MSPSTIFWICVLVAITAIILGISIWVMYYVEKNPKRQSVLFKENTDAEFEIDPVDSFDGRQQIVLLESKGFTCPYKDRCKQFNCVLSDRGNKSREPNVFIKIMNRTYVVCKSFL